MKIALLLKREPFGKIFEQTLTSFLDEFYKNKYKVKWFQRKLQINKNPGVSCQKWFCNPLINSIYVKGVNDKVFDSVKWEYSKNPLKPWRSVFQRFYLYLAIKTKLGPFLASYLIIISPEISNAHNILVIGGNNKIRVIDYKSKSVFVILKKGFHRKYLEREITIRQNYGYLPVPSIKQLGKTDWYSEELISGISPDRLNKESGNHVLLESTQKLHRLLTDTVIKDGLKKYTDEIILRIKNIIESMNRFDISQKRDILEYVDSIASGLKKSSYFQSDNIYTAVTHGDFQSGNILFDGSKVWILDWEHSRRRQVGNDLFVLLLMPRYPVGFACRFLNMVDNQVDSIGKRLLSNWPYLNWKNDRNRKVMLKLFLLEEIDFLLEENDNSLFYGQSFGLSPFFKELKKILEH
jgi:thiamine kinase-like enzyme